MSLGWAPNDIVVLAKLAYEIFSFCRNAPEELQGLLNKLEKIARKLEQFSTVLEKSGFGTWQQAPALKQNLLDVRAYLEPLRTDNNNNNSIPSKAKRLARLALNQDKLRRIEKTLDENERDINDMKIDSILACSLRNLQYGLDPRLSPNPLNGTRHLLDGLLPTPMMASEVSMSSESDRTSIASTVSNASKALVMAMALASQPIRDVEAVTTRDNTPESSLRDVQIASDFIADVVSLAEEKELYSKDADLTQNLDQLTEITEKATHLLAIHPSSLDDSFEKGIWNDLSSMSDNSCIRRWAVIRSQSQAKSSNASETHSVTPPISCSGHTPLNQVPLLNLLGHDDEVFQVDITSLIDAFTRQLDNATSNKELIGLRGRSEVSLNMKSKSSMTCSFDFELFEGSVRLGVASINRKHSASDVVFATGELPPTTSSSGFSSSQLMSDHVYARIPIAFQHCFQSQARPIPHLLHPDIEGPTEEPDAPYTITFTERQYISEEGPSISPRWTTSLMYIFHDRQDRITLCEKIFGKTLVIIAGSNKITYDGQELSHMSAIALWFDNASGTKSITFSPNFTGQNTAWKDIEVIVHGLWDVKKTRRTSNALAIVAESMSRVDEDLFDDGSSIKSGTTRLSRVSSTVSPKWKKFGKLKCNIEFTRSSDRAMFLSHLM